MLDIDFIRDNRKLVEDAARNKQYDVDIEKLLRLDEQRRELIEQAESLRQKRNEHAQNLKGGKPSEQAIAAGKEIKESLAAVETKLSPVLDEFTWLLKQVPNIASEDTPIGESEDENKVVDTWGETDRFSFEPKNHWEIAEARNWIDKERAAKVAGARFAYLKGELVQLQFALMQYVVDQLTDSAVIAQLLEKAGVDEASDKPFIPVLPPLMIREEVFDGMDRLEPREDRYKIEGQDLWLQGSAEHVMGCMYQNEILEAKDLPIRMLGYATSFRGEAGTYGKDMEGIIRMHQFDKLEMIVITTAEQGMNEHLLTVAVQEHLMQQLEIPYRKLLKCTADIGKPNFRGVDLDAWLPGQGKYRETHTADYMSDYQARRLKTRVRLEDGSLALVHNIDATAFALGRALVAILENYQTEDMKVRVPKALQSYMGGREEL